MTTLLDQVHDPGADVAAYRQRVEELGRIILAYSEITERLQKSHEQLTETVGRLRAELGEKNRQLERRNRLAALGEMAAGMAHEIRNPLGAIQLYASLLARDVAGMPESAGVVVKISGAVRRLEDTVSKVLQFTRELRVNPCDGDVVELTSECVEMASARGMGRGVKVEFSGTGRLIARFDRLTLGQAITNVVVNAVEASPPDGTVNVGCFADAGRTVVRVVDCGTGISGEVAEKLFNPFFTTKDEGTGLGLAIVHRVMEAHDGTVTVRNGERGGAVFELRW
jgi:signal transduction histidine kinase